MARTLLLHGASGGLGTSTLAAAVALAASGPGRAVLVDADPVHGLADHALVAEHLPGLRWGDLAGVRGGVDGDAVLARLPSVAGVPVLAGSGEAVPAEVVAAVSAALHAVVDTVVLDGGRTPSPGMPSADLPVLLAGVGSVPLAAAVRAAGSGAPVWAGVVTRSANRVTGALGAALAEHLGLPHLGTLRDDPRVRRAAERGSSRPVGPVGEVARGLVRLLSAEPVAGPAPGRPAAATAGVAA